MTHFRKFVEDQIEQVIHQPEPTVLTDEIKAKVLEKVNSMDIDVDDLSSATYDSNPYGVEPQLAGGSGEWDYDEDEYFAKQIEKFLDYMHHDGIIEYIDIPKEKWDDAGYLKRLETEIDAWLTAIEPIY